jgi:hypothetical protein
VTVDADDFAMQDGSAVTAVAFFADHWPSTLGTAYLDYLALVFPVCHFKTPGATDDLGAVRCAGSLLESNHLYQLATLACVSPVRQSHLIGAKA